MNDPCEQCGHPLDPHILHYTEPDYIVAVVMPGFAKHAIDYAESDPEYASRAKVAFERFGQGLANGYMECPVEDCRCLITLELPPRATDWMRER